MKYMNKKSITNELAKELIEAAENKAKELGVAVNTTILDESGNLICFSKMDHAKILSIEISQNKAYSAVSFGKPTHEWYPPIKDEPSLLYGITHTPKLTIFGGGYPIYIEGHMIGGIGVSGGTLEEDMACCEAALQMLED